MEGTTGRRRTVLTAAVVAFLAVLGWQVEQARHGQGALAAAVEAVNGAAVKPQVVFPAPDAQERGAARAVLDVARAEAANPGPGTKYANGVEEPWCADFVSWVYKRAGMPLRNPTSGGWRIPGTMSLKDALVAAHRWHPYGDGYRPRPGDIAVYDGAGPWGQHTNIVVPLDGDALTTVGGNQIATAGEPGTVTVTTMPLDDRLKVIGFGALR